MANATPQEQLLSDINSIKSDVDSLQSKVNLSSLRDSLEDLETRITGLPQVITGLRARNYAFEKGLEGQATNLASSWAVMRPSLQAQINQQSLQLQGAMRSIEAQMTQLAAWSNNPTMAGPVVSQLKMAVDNLESKASAAGSNIQGAYDTFANEVNTLVNHLEKVEWTLKQVDEASFPFLPTEAGIMAVKATLWRSNKESKDDPEGILMLTDQRLLFEQKEEVATKKVLFVTTARQKVQKLIFETPVALVEGVKASKQGLFKNEDHLDLQFSSAAPVSSAHLHLDGQDCNLWTGLINRAKAHDFDKERAIAVDQSAVEKAKAAPTICPNCGGTIKQVVMRGMDSMTCEYCGAVIRL
jgi:hypothetical protein